MPHPLALALYDTIAAAANGASAARTLGIDREHVSVVASTHRQEAVLAEQLGATPGVEIEDSPAAARIGELGAHVAAAVALVMPGIGPIVAAGPLAAELGEAAGHAAGGVATILMRAGIAPPRARSWEQRIDRGAVLLGVHTTNSSVDAVRAALEQSGARDIAIAEWP